jgi:hypothetical protein
MVSKGIAQDGLLSEEQEVCNLMLLHLVRYAEEIDKGLLRSPLGRNLLPFIPGGGPSSDDC